MDSEQRKQRSVGGIGQVDTIALDPLICPDCYVVTYLTPIPPMVSVGDAFYDGGNLSGTIKEIQIYSSESAYLLNNINERLSIL